MRAVKNLEYFAKSGDFPGISSPSGHLKKPLGIKFCAKSRKRAEENFGGVFTISYGKSSKNRRAKRAGNFLGVFLLSLGITRGSAPPQVI